MKSLHSKAAGSAAGECKIVALETPDTDDVAREETFRRLAALVSVKDSVPEDVRTSARLSFEFRSLDDELAALVYDSMIDDDLLAGVRSGGSSTRQLTFASSSIVLELEVSDGASRSVVGQVVPPQPAEVVLRHRTGVAPISTDDLGWFQVPDVPDGPVSFRCSLGDRSADSVTTSWVTL
jgi:hypothetical protein